MVLNINKIRCPSLKIQGILILKVALGVTLVLEFSHAIHIYLYAPGNFKYGRKMKTYYKILHGALFGITCGSNTTQSLRKASTNSTLWSKIALNPTPKSGSMVCQCRTQKQDKTKCNYALCRYGELLILGFHCSIQ